MHIPYAWDPAIHHLVELPVTRFLRRELNLPNLVTYVHEIFKTWVVSLRDGDDAWSGGRLLDIGMLGSGEGEGQWCSRENVVAIISRMKDLISKYEVRERMKARQVDEMRDLDRRQVRTSEAHQKIYRELRSRHGPLVADEYAQRVGVDNCRPPKREAVVY